MIDYYKELEIQEDLALDAIDDELCKLELKWQRREVSNPEKARKKLMLINKAKEIFSSGENKSKYDKELQVARENGAVQSSEENLDELFKRIKSGLEDSKWQDTVYLCNKVLSIDQSNAYSYVYKLLADLHLTEIEDLAKSEVSFEDNENYKKALKFSDDLLRQKLQRYNKESITFRKNLAKESVYLKAKKQTEAENYVAALDLLSKISGYKDSEYLIKDIKFKQALLLMEDGSSEENLKEALEILEALDGFLNSDELAGECSAKLKKIDDDRQAQAEKEQQKKKLTKRVLIGVAIAAAALLVAYLVVTYAVPTIKYANAENLMQNEQYEQAAEKYASLNGYKDSAEKAEICSKKATASNGLSNFGTYAGNELCWDVLKVENGKALVVSSYIIDNMKFADVSSTSSDVSWDTSQIRQWLNGDFYNTSFSAEEKARIQLTTVKPDRSPEEATAKRNEGRGVDTQDHVFLLSAKEADNLFEGDEQRAAKASSKAVADGASVNESGNCSWWLRTYGYHTFRIANVKDSGQVDYRGWDANVARGVRPAMWVTL